MQKRHLKLALMAWIVVTTCLYCLTRLGFMGDIVIQIILIIQIPVLIVYAILERRLSDRVWPSIFWERYNRWHEQVAQNKEPEPPTECLICGHALSQCGWSKNQTYCSKCRLIWSAETAEYQAYLRRTKNQVNVPVSTTDNTKVY